MMFFHLSGKDIIDGIKVSIHSFFYEIGYIL